MSGKRRLIFGWGLAAGLVLASCTAGSHTSSVSITDIQSVAELQSRFAEDAGVPRLILLLSHT